MNDNELRKRIQESDPAKNYNYQLGENLIMQQTKKEKETKKFAFSPKFALATASTLVVAGLVGVGTFSNILPQEQTPLLTLSADGNSGAPQSGLLGGVAEDASAPAKSDMLWYQPYNYIYLPGESLSRDAGTSNGYRLALPSNPESFFNKVAKAFGLGGEKVAIDPYGYDSNYYVIGDYNSYNGEILAYSHSGAGYWSYSNSAAYASIEQYPEECYSRTTSIDEEGNVTETLDDGLAAMCDSWRPTPPVGLPSAATAKEYANNLFNSIYGESFDLQVYADEYSVSVSGSKKVEDTEVGLSVGVSWSGSEVSYAYGFSVSPELITGLSLISPFDATERIGDYRWWGYNMGGIVAYPMGLDSSMGTARSADSDSGAVAGSEGSLSGGASDSGEGEVSIQPVPEIGVPYPGDDFVIEDKEITLVGATLKLLVVYAADGSMWLLPGYVYETSEELMYAQAPSIIAVDESLIKLG
jgi:hypothetical protein